MTVIYALWLFTAAYSTQLAAYPTPEGCAAVALSVNAAMHKEPVTVGKLACIPLVLGAPAEQRSL